VTAVPNRIDGNEIRPVRVTAGTAVRKSGDDATGKAGSGHAPAQDVHITSTARTLAALEQAVLDLPAIDEQRVAAVRERLASGGYSVDPQRIADGLLRMEGALWELGKQK
jgi:negative regulator of flagellin synthesis FlgM